jgi:hypothetical protein
MSRSAAFLPTTLASLLALGFGAERAGAQVFGQPYPCSIQVSGNSQDCRGFGLGDEVNGCLKVDGFLSNDGTEDLKEVLVTVLVDTRVITNMRAVPVTGPVKPGTKAPYSGAAKYELTQAVMLNSRMYSDRPEMECLLSAVR